MSSRIWEEWNDIMANPLTYVGVGLDKGNIRKWRASIIGPDETPYAGGCFIAEINFPNDYPATKPTFKFATRIYHPNISERGGICLDVINQKYRPEYKISYLLQCITAMLKYPNGKHGLRGDLVSQFNERYQEYFEMARKETYEYAM